VRRHDGELFAPKARYDVMITSKIFQALGDGSQHFVSDVMSVGVVHLLEMVEIQYHQPDWLADAPEVVEVFPQRVIKVAAVLQARQTLRQRCLFKRVGAG